jgi:NADP+-dependent farnesol dehydrogenase
MKDGGRPDESSMSLNTAKRRRGILFGASAGVGAAAAQLLGQRDDLLLLSRRGEVSAGIVGQSAKCDVRDYSQVERCIASFGSELDYVVSCIGIGYFAPFDADYSKWWRDITDTNINGNINILSNVVRLRPQCQQVVVLGSVAARRYSRTPGNAVYRASKAALAALLDDARIDLRARGSKMRICNLAPGFIEGTAFGANYFDSAPCERTNLYGAFAGLQPAQVARVIEWVLSTEPGVDVSDLVLRPTAQPD